MKEEFISNLQSMLREFSHVSDSVPHGIKIILQENLWQEREPAPGKLNKKTFKNFKEFCEASTPFGLNTPFEYVLNICKPYNDVLDLIDEANRNKHGGDRKSENFKMVNHHLEKNTMRQSIQSNLRRLRDNRPDLHKKVFNNEISSYSAMIEAGYLERKIGVKVNNVEHAYKVITENFSKEKIKELISLLKLNYGI